MAKQKSQKHLRKENLKKEEEKIEQIQKKIEELNVEELKKNPVSQFDELPISENTIKGLKASGFISMTDIQKETVPLSLKGFDILGAARTGSGKTLAFLIPLIEKLYLNKWNEFDGLGALVISPTRELAMQIYEELVKIGKYCNFSAGLVIGGKDLKFEKERISKMNILIGTPGRILQHMDQTIGLELNNLQMLVLDEADRILDMGFKKTIDNIVNNLPPTRQTLLFSATQTKSVNDLARLSLINPQYVDTEIDNNNDNKKSTPDTLDEYYISIELENKLNILWSFLKTHLNSKIIVFFSSSKQVHFVYETFRKLQPGISLMKLHGRQKQTARMESTYKFSKANHVCLLATDIVARGLDFPSIDWVIQIDCPESVDTYIHRVGRAARLGKNGKSLLILTKNEEEGFLSNLKLKNIEPKKMIIKSSKIKSIQSQLQSICFQNPDLKYLGQKAFISYCRSIYIQHDKTVFDISKLSLEEFAKSFGLPGAPKIKFKGNNNAEALAKIKELKNASRQLLKLSKLNDDGEEIKEDKDNKVRTKYDRMFERKNQDVLSEHYLKTVNNQDNDDNEEDFMKVKRSDHEIVEEELPDLTAPASKRQLKKSLSRKASSLATGVTATKLKFDDEGNAHPIYELNDGDEYLKEGDINEKINEYVEKERDEMQERDEEDKIVAKGKRQDKKRRRKELERRANESSDEDSEDDEETAYVVGTGDIDKDYEEDSGSDEEPSNKKAKWFNNDKINGKESGKEGIKVVELDEPETVEDLEALTERLLQS